MCLQGTCMFISAVYDETLSSTTPSPTLVLAVAGGSQPCAL